MATDALSLNDLEYLEMPGLNVMLAHDYYPDGHQGGVGIILHGRRVATNGDLRLDESPGQWSPIPKVGKREVDRATQEVRVQMEYPDEHRNRKGFNPIEYPANLQFTYVLRVRPEGKAFRIMVDLEVPLPADWVGKVGLNLELFPGDLLGRSYALDNAFGVFPTQANGPETPLATGKKLTVAPETDLQRYSIEVVIGGELQLIDGRGKHNNGWFIVRSPLTSGAKGRVAEWLITPHIQPNWRSKPTIQVSQVGYHPDQPKVAVIEVDRTDTEAHPISLVRVLPQGGLEEVLTELPREWGRFLRYRYLQFDFSKIRQPGMYVVRYAEHETVPFAISPTVFSRGVWQPTVETFLPVQMCHMRINDRYRVWHGACHLDDARMAPVNLNHFDGYLQGPMTLTKYNPGDHIPGLDRGGWHDAGDTDIRVESQSETVYGLSLAYERFKLDYDNTTVDQVNRVVELHRPDGKPDVLQQIEHGALSIVGGYRSLGRLYRGVIDPTLQQYTLLGDPVNQTDNTVFVAKPRQKVPAVGLPGSADDRWVFTELNPNRELQVAAALAAASRVLGSLNPDLAVECLSIAKELYVLAKDGGPRAHFGAALELYLATQDSHYREAMIVHGDVVAERPQETGWLLARSIAAVNDPIHTEKVVQALRRYRFQVDDLQEKNPYGLPYSPDIWGAGWGIQRFGFQQYWLHALCPEIFSSKYMLNAISFILGCHPGSNTASFVSGVGAKSAIPGYGLNRADNSYIPGGTVSGTALIRPDFPELLEWPYLWQQTEYCVGSSTSDYVFLIAAADHLLNGSEGF